MDKPRHPHVVRTWTVERIRAKAPTAPMKPQKRQEPVRKKKT
jgi:hypothetical protein